MILITFATTATMVVTAAAADNRTPVSSASSTGAMSQRTPTLGRVSMPRLVASPSVDSTDSRLVQAAKSALASRAANHKSRIVIDSTTLLVSGVHTGPSPMNGAPLPVDNSGRSWATGNQNDASAIESREREKQMRLAAEERARVETLHREQSYRAMQNDDYTPNDGDEDHIEQRLSNIPTEIAKPPL